VDVPHRESEKYQLAVNGFTSAASDASFSDAASSQRAILLFGEEGVPGQNERVNFPVA